LRIVRDPGGGWQLEGSLVRAGEELALDDIVVLTSAGLVFRESCISRFDAAGAWPILPLLREPEPLVVPDADLFAFAAELHLMPNAPPIEWPQNFRIEEAHPVPVPCLRVRRADDDRFAYGQLPVELGFDYDGMVIASRKSGRALVQHEPPRLIHRNPELERAARNRLIELGARELYDWRHTRPRLGIAPKQLDAFVAALTAEGWRVEADGRRFRAASRTQVNVSSGIDWFELQGAIEFGDQIASLPRLLSALRNGEKTVLLDDGSYGLLPVEWLQRFAGIAALASTDEDASAMRFTIAQTSLLDALLATLPEPRVDETFVRIRDELRHFEAITPVAAPDTFKGELRHYQQEGLGWIEFLRRFGLGGCLADDMGLGKTVQVLALLEQCRAAGNGPSLVVVPKSLVFNWRREAERFTPALRVRDHTGGQRHREPLDSASFDVLLTTYGTLRRDAPHLRELEFEYVILDEAQAIKNAKTASAKAALLLRGRNRLALSGTPIENRLEELWSLFEFLNPGMLGASTAFATLKNLSGNGSVPEGRAMLARALRPFILRRTKEQVAPELPPRVEQTLIVELEKEQRALYDELRVHYRHALLARIDKIGIKRARIEILEALLRLRQAACHPGLIDARHTRAGSAKLDVLLAQLEEIVAEGHRALVFSQFTSFLALVRERLDAEGIVYEYLDGKTRDREARVQRFQTDAQCPVFLISLRAGGHGLNLTAADYVFVLDPWWNPAVEAQAVDRTHRIGQQRHVFALRLIARDTVEEKVLELQQQKRELADAILNADAGGLSAIGREELERLLG
jgi:SNF2 family DNA or RNA helicase